MEVAIVSEVPIKEQRKSGSLRPGDTIRQSLLKGDAPDGLNFRFVRSQYQAGEKAFQSPRHRHGFQQIRWTESGSANYAPGQDIPEGDIAYFPRGTYYGPQLKSEGVGLLLQYGFDGEHQSGPKWERHRVAALEKLRARGELEDGLFVEIDPETGERRERDANQALYEAQYEEQTQRKFVIPPEGYASAILMHAAAFSYYQTGPGVEVKHLGRFYDHAGPNADVRISMIRLSGEGEYVLSAERAQIAWTRDPGLRIEGQVYPELTCFYCPRGEQLLLGCEQCIEIYLVELPRLD